MAGFYIAIAIIVAGLMVADALLGVEKALLEIARAMRFK